MKRGIILHILLLFAAVSVVAARTSDRVISRRYVMENGLSSNRVYSIVQDSLGFIWFGTNDGLNRFDGLDFRKYYYTGEDGDGMSSNSVRWLLISRDNRMWIALDNGVDVYDPQTGVFSHFDVRTDTGEAISGRVLRIAEDADGELWIGTMTDGLYRYTPSTGRLRVYRHDPADASTISQNSVASLLVDSEGVVWVGTYDQGLCAFSKRTGRFTAYRKQPGGLSDNQVHSIYEDAVGYLWIGTYSSGIDCFDRQTGRFVNYRDGRPGSLLHHIHDIVAYGPDEILVASDNGVGIFQIEEGVIRSGDKHKPRVLPVANELVYKAYKDREGGLWLGSYFYGAEYFPPMQHNFRFYGCDNCSSSGKGRIIKALSEGEKGIIWVGTDDDGVYTVNTLTGEVKPFRTASDIGASQYIVSDLLYDGNQLFVATYERGLEVFDLRTGRMKSYSHDPDDEHSLPSSRVFVLFKSATGRIYLGTANGLCRYDREQDCFVRLGIPVRIAAIAEDGDHNLWIATKEDGLYRYDVRTGACRHYLADPDNPHSLVRNVLTVLTVDHDGRLWIGSDGYGVCRYDAATDAFVRYDDLPLPNRIISGIVPSGETLWIATNKGLVRWNTATNVTRLFSRSDGLYNEQFSERACLVDYSGLFVLGTTDGLCTFSPHRLTDNNRAVPPVVLTSLSIYNRPVTPRSDGSPLVRSIETTREVVLAHDQRMLSIEFAALSYVDPAEMLYRYKLDGFDDKWYVTDGRNRIVNYNNLPSGRYTLRIESAGNNRVWGGGQTVLDIVVRPHALKSPVALTLYALILLLGLTVLIRYLLRRSDRKHSEKLRQLEAKTRQEVYDAKINFFTHITHEIRTPLSLIIGPLEYIRKSRPMNDRYGEYLDIIEMNYKRLFALVTQLLDFRKVDSGNYRLSYAPCGVKELVDGIVPLFGPTARQRGIRLNVAVEPQDLTLITDREALTKILSNLLSNAIKHASGYIWLEVRQCGELVTFVVGDDGPGVAPAEREKIFRPFYQVASDRSATKGSGIGLHMTRQLVELLGGTISVSDRDDGLSGASFRVELPVRGTSAADTGTESRLHEFIIDDLISESPADSDPEAVEEAGAPVRRYTVMLVDDNAEILDFLTRVLGERYFCIAVASSEEALLMLAKNRVDLVISDVMMDGMDGLELCRRIKTDIDTSHIPVVLLTAKTNLETKIQGLEYGADAYIEKPFSIAHLNAQLTNLIAGRNRLREVFVSTPQPATRIEAYNRLDQEFVDRCTAIITENITVPDFSIEMLAQEMGMSRTSVFVKLKAITGTTPNDFIKLIRLKVACKLMAEGHYRATEVGFLVGFNSSSYFAKCFFKQFGMRPNDYIKSLERAAPGDGAEF